MVVALLPGHTRGLLRQRPLALLTVAVYGPVRQPVTPPVALTAGRLRYVARGHEVGGSVGEGGVKAAHHTLAGSERGTRAALIIAVDAVLARCVPGNGPTGTRSRLAVEGGHRARGVARPGGDG